MKKKDDIHIHDPSSTTIIFVGAIGLITILAVMGFTIGLFYDAERQEAIEKIVARPNERLETSRRQQLENLNSYGWVNQQEGVVRVPIDRAMSLVVADLRAERVAAE